MKYVFMIFLSLLPTLAIAQDERVEGVDIYAGCSSILEMLPVSELAESSMEGLFGPIGKSYRPILIGKICSVKQIKDHYFQAGWKLGRWGVATFDIPASDARHTYDTQIHFCFPERGFWKLFNKCRGFGSVSLLKGKITWIEFASSIKIGG